MIPLKEKDRFVAHIKKQNEFYAIKFGVVAVQNNKLVATFNDDRISETYKKVRGYFLGADNTEYNVEFNRIADISGSSVVCLPVLQTDEQGLMREKLISLIRTDFNKQALFAQESLMREVSFFKSLFRQMDQTASGIQAAKSAQLCADIFLKKISAEPEVNRFIREHCDQSTTFASFALCLKKHTDMFIRETLPMIYTLFPIFYEGLPKVEEENAMEDYLNERENQLGLSYDLWT